MIEVKIRKVTENITFPGALGMQSNQPCNYLQLYFAESGEVVPDNTYKLKQGTQERICSITGGQARGVEWIDSNQAIFLI